MRTALYRHFDADGQLLYVGITSDPRRRLSEHLKAAKWPIASVDLEWFDNDLSAVRAERKAILTESPIHNIRRDTKEPPITPDRGWRKCLADTLVERELSLRAVSIGAGLGKGYLHSIILEGKDPTLGNFLKICDFLCLDVSEVLKSSTGEAPQ